MRAESATKEYIKLAKRFPLLPIKNRKHLKEAASVIKELAEKENLSPEEHGYFLVLADLIEAYENKLGRLGPQTTPEEALKYLMEVNGLSQKDLVPIVGQKTHLSAFLSGKRAMSKNSAIRLGQYFRVSPMLFLPRLQVL